MVCLVCGERLPLLRNLELGNFCSPAHRELFERLQHTCTEEAGGKSHRRAAPVSLRALTRPRNQRFQRGIPVTPSFTGTSIAVPPGGALQRSCTPQALLRLPRVLLRRTSPAPRPLAAMEYPLRQFAPRPLDLNLVEAFEAIRRTAFAEAPSADASAPRKSSGRRVWRPLMLAASAATAILLAARLWQPVQAAANQSGLRGWSRVRHDIADRAAISMVDDFRTGLDAWSSGGRNLSWSYDEVGCIRPAALAIYDPSLTLSDYSFEFLGQLRNKGMGVAVRAADVNNYYAVRLVVARPGPLPIVNVVRYPVIGGREGTRVSTPLPVTIRPDSLFRARILARGDEFTLMVQDRVADNWTDARFRKGGVGFFCLRGDDARLRWVEITHHDDTLGRLCALIAPFRVTAANGSWEK